MDFDLFNKISSAYDQQTTDQNNVLKKSCPHQSVTVEMGIHKCNDCGEHLQQAIAYEKEWRYYGNSDHKHTSDPTRVQFRKTDVVSIRKDISHMGFSDKIIDDADRLYKQVTKGQIYRGESRKAVIFACIFHAYKLSGKCQTPNGLMTTFGLSKKNSLKGMKIVNVNLPKDSPIHLAVLTPVHHMNDIMDKFSATKTQKDDVCKLYERIRNRSSKLNRARPQSVAAAVIFYWITTNNIDIPIKQFAKHTELSELTISKNVKEIDSILH